MTSSTTTARRGGPVVGLLVLLWLVGLLALLWWAFALGMESWADQQSNGGARAAELGRQGNQLLLALAVVAAGGPALIALAAYWMRLVRTGTVFLVLAVAIGIPALWVAAHAYRDLAPSPPPPGPPGHCVELSGGDTRCPGG
ncbi:DUF6234 family protein [Micromonospora soli]|uniref:DUF6234 family protein n=1 Tax=Micromonospora sp. NBRC 110009 TaxID=3061627 RepID=UPI0026722354|nr:DUF6234 family protein [Micromonospora sp. NBRC 110009]WKU01806.1 DUF6234 family protein [Micromonospora sp. NBRC 110009]